ncbi:Urea/Na+ high-affinity symporter [Tribonema minus]|uniref:Urea/Na+ high-affinity symporter n=1 Tax=Tribonema minus TaxID=303371 RepID=A0A835Z2D2_9STRA|nr:Urea/Na+ high-affinity symporter [Tribonema minus]
MATCTETSVPLEYQDQGSFFEGKTPLPLGVGYAVVVGFGVFFTFLTMFLVWLEKRYSSVKTISSEEFNTAGRSIKTGLTASNIVSMWTWAATLLQSSNVAWQYGVSGPFWYASGATIQVLLFGILAIEIKRRAPTAHTFCEIVRARWGTAAHISFLYFGFLTNIIVTSMLLLGGASVTSALTGMDLNLACFLIPWGVIAYTVAGGLKAAYMVDYTHTCFLMVILVMFVFAIYAGDSAYVGSPTAMHDMLSEVSEIENCKYGPECQFTLTACGPVSGNKDGSYLTMLSKDGFIFGVINVIGNFGTVFLDQGYWQAAIAAKPSASHKGYLIGGLCWFTIPFALATSLGLAAVAMQLPVTHGEAGSGLVPAATAYFIMGKGGATAILIMLYMAITASGSHEIIAVSSLITYDIYKVYFYPNATGDQILRFSHYCCLFFGIVSGLLAIILNQIGVNLGWVYVSMGNFIGSGVIPVTMLLFWKKASGKAAIAGLFAGQIGAIIAWIVTAKAYYGAVNIDNLGANYSALAGNLVAILFGGFVTFVMSMMAPDNYDFVSMKEIALLDQDTDWLENGDYDEDKLAHAKSWILKWGGLFTLVIVVLWPILSLAAGVFSSGYFSFWVGISAAWGLIACTYLIFMPLIESWADIMHVVYGLFGLGEYKSTSKTLADMEARISALEGNTIIKPTKKIDDVEAVAMTS